MKTLFNVVLVLVVVLLFSSVPASAQSAQEGTGTMEDWDVVAILAAIGAMWWRLDRKIEGVRSDSNAAHGGISTSIDGVKTELMKLNMEVGTANGKLSILEAFFKKE